MHVAPFVDAWIETKEPLPLIRQTRVAPFVGAWIETKEEVSLWLMSWSHICELITIDYELELKDELMVEYATYGIDSQLFVPKFDLYLPSKEELKRLVGGIIGDAK